MCRHGVSALLHPRSATVVRHSSQLCFVYVAQKRMMVDNIVEHERGLLGHVVSADASEMHMQPVPEM